MIFFQLTTVCYLNDHPSTNSESKCRYDLDEFLLQISSTNHQFMQPSVVFSHVPLDHLSSASQGANVKSRILSSLVGTTFIFSGHIHHMMYNHHNVKVHASLTPLSIRRGLDNELPPTELANTRHTAYEITVPTCSYRMGERHMGVGAALLSEFQFEPPNLQYSLITGRESGKYNTRSNSILVFCLQQQFHEKKTLMST